MFKPNDKIKTNPNHPFWKGREYKGIIRTANNNGVPGVHTIDLDCSGVAEGYWTHWAVVRENEILPR